MSKIVFSPETDPPETIVEMGRLNGLSDGIFAFALTLLVLDIRLPEDVLAGDLMLTLPELAPRLLIYLISFVVIGGAWGSHQRLLSQVKRGDGLLVWFNLLSLLFVTLLPAASALLGRFPDTLIAIVCFAADVILIQLTALLLWRHASKHDLINPALDPRVVVSIGRRLILSAVAFGLSVLLGLWNPNVVYLVWIGLFILIFTTDWLSWQQAVKTVQATIPLDNAARAQINIEHGAGHLFLAAGIDSDVLARGTFGGGLKSNLVREGDLLKAQLSVSGRQGIMSWRYPWAWGPANVLDWKLSLNPHIPLALHIETGTGQADFDFTELQIIHFTLKTSLSSVNMSLPTHAGQTTVIVEAGSSSLMIYIPVDVAARIRATKALSNMEVDLERFTLVTDGKEYCSKNYDTATNRVDIQLEIALGSIRIPALWEKEQEKLNR
jgi:uncharacterized membrane protein